VNIKPDCLVCLMNQTLKVSKLLKLDDNTSKRLLDNTAQQLTEYDLNHTPPQIAKSIYSMISEVTGESDPLALAKEEATKLALSIDTDFVQTLQDAVKLAVIGNVIDFGAQKQFDLNEMIQDHFHRSFGINDLNKFEHELKEAKKLVYIGDNVGEHIFDKLLIEMIKKHYPHVEVYYFVRGKPIINDVTVKEAQILKDSAHIIDTGTETPGYDLSALR